MERVAADDFTGVAIDQERKYKKAINEFLQFCEENYGETLSEEEAEATFISFLKDHDLDILFINQRRDTLLPEANVSTAQRFLMNSFVKKAYETEPEIFSFIVDMSVGHIISSTLLCQDYEKFQGKLVGGNFYLDIGFLFSIMGIDGPEKEEAYIEYIRLLSSHKANLFVFRHTYNEFMGILESCLQWIESASFDPLKASRSLIYFIDNGFTASDVERFILGVDQKLSKLEIAVAETLDPSKDQIHQIDEEKLQELIVEVYKDRDPYFDEEEKERTLYRDVKSISAVYKLRKGHKPKRLSKARFVFVTTNSSLAYVSRLFETEQFDHSYFSIPTALTDVFVGTLIWINSPSIASMNEKRLIANCYAALQPTKVLVRKLVEAANRLKEESDITEDEVVLLKESRVARNLLQRETLGDPDRFMDKTAIDILEEIRANIRKEEQEKLSREREDMHAQVQEAQRTAQKAQEQLRCILSQVVELDRIKEHLDENARKYANRVLWLSLGALGLIWLILVILIWQLGWSKMEPWTFILGFGGPILGYAYFVVTQKEFSPKAIYEQVIESRKEKNYQTFGFDWEKHRRLKEQEARLSTDIS